MGLGQCIAFMTSMPGTISGFAVMGLVGGFTHCAAMCGPFVMAQQSLAQDLQSQDAPNSVIGMFKNTAMLPYHFGRMTTYIVLACLFGTVLNLAFAVMPIRLFIVVPMLLLAAVVFAVAALPDLGKLFPWAVRFHLPRFFQHLSQKLITEKQKNNSQSQYMLGIALGFMPCGLLLAALMAGAALGDVAKTALAMAAFTFGTIPSLWVIAMGGQTIRTRYPQVFGKVRQAFLLISALWLFALAGAAVF